MYSVYYFVSNHLASFGADELDKIIATVCCCVIIVCIRCQEDSNATILPFICHLVKHEHLRKSRFPSYVALATSILPRQNNVQEKFKDIED